MKTSNKILVGTGLLFATLIIILMIVGRFMLGVNPDRDDDYDDMERDVVTNYDFSGFKKIEIYDNWNVTIRQGDQFAVEVSMPGSVIEKAKIEVVGDRLIFKNRSFRYRKGELEAFVTMPTIESITSADATSIELDSFTCDQLKIKLDGACKIRARNNVIADLHLSCNGAARVDLAESVVKNAALQVNGAGFIEINMDGGELTGMASGAARIVYSGSVSSEKIKTFGAVSVKHRD